MKDNIEVIDGMNIDTSADDTAPARVNSGKAKGFFIAATVLTVIATVIMVLVMTFFFGVIDTKIQLENTTDESTLGLGIGLAVLLVYLILFVIIELVASSIGLLLSIPAVKMAVNKLKTAAIIVMIIDIAYIVVSIGSFAIAYFFCQG